MNERQQRFVERYLLHLNASKAALEIGCKPCSARASGWKYRHHPKVAAAIEARMAERAQRLRVSAERVVEELARLAFSDIGNIAQWGTGSLTLKPNDDVAIDDRVAIAELSLDQGKGKSRRTRIKLHDKQRALETLARHLGLFDGRGGSMTADEIGAAREGARAPPRANPEAPRAGGRGPGVGQPRRCHGGRGVRRPGDGARCGGRDRRGRRRRRDE